MKTRELILLSILILLIPVAIYFFSTSKEVGDFGSLLGAFTGIVAIIWFYRGLRLQSLQIEGQRLQFEKQHHIQCQDSLLAFLQKASERIEKSHDELVETLSLSHSNQLPVCYLNTMRFYKEALESTDPNIVISQVQEWMKIEGPCIKFMSSVKDVISLHKKRLGLKSDTDESDVADYVYINSTHLLQQPFMSSYQVAVKMLSEQMMLLAPGRKAMVLASTTAMALIAPDGLMKKDKIIEDIEKSKKEGKPIPKICEIYC